MIQRKQTVKDNEETHRLNKLRGNHRSKGGNFSGLRFAIVIIFCNILLFLAYVHPSKSYSHLFVTSSEETVNKSNDFHTISIYSKAAETQPIKTKSSYSQAKQDLVILALTEANDAKVAVKDTLNAALRTTNNDKNNGRKFFVDLAANEAVVLSNSYLLEKNGWDGLCLEPNPLYWYRLASYRTCTIVGAMVGGTPQEDGKEVDVILATGGVGGGIVGEGMDNEKKEVSGEKRNLVSISTVFQAHHVPNIIDYLSLDVEGAETIVMEHFAWDQYQFKFITIERPKDDLKAMLVSNGYKQVKKITYWGETLWIHETLVALTKADIEAIFTEKGLDCDRCV